jgi:hypothetical protein
MIIQGKNPAAGRLVNIRVETGMITRVETPRADTVPDYGGPED